MRPAGLLVVAIACGEPDLREVVSPASAAPATSAVSAASAVSATSALVVGPAPPPGMREIPEGIFLMGSRHGQGNPEERPMHERVVARFYLDETEVTWGAYRACVDAGACTRPRPDDDFCNHRSTGRDAHPVNCVDWNDAVAFCEWKGKRLPTEAEWEYAASGGAEGRRFSWGDVDPDRTRACFDHAGGTCPVASFAAGAFGLFDMSGNVWEWTASFFSLPPGEAKEGKRRVFKGGSWSRRWPKWLRTRNRSHWEPEKLNSWLGFRCAKSFEPLTCPAHAAATAEGRCERSGGDPLCEPGFGWNGRACTQVGTDGRPAPGLGEIENRPKPGDPGMPGNPDDPVMVTRAPQDDADCVKNYREKVAGYRWKGSTWDKRVGLIKTRGCTRRDNGPDWIGACCRE